MHERSENVQIKQRLKGLVLVFEFHSVKVNVVIFNCVRKRRSADQWTGGSAYTYFFYFGENVDIDLVLF